jgi:hypothetical protein
VVPAVHREEGILGKVAWTCQPVNFHPALVRTLDARCLPCEVEDPMSLGLRERTTPLPRKAEEN